MRRLAALLLLLAAPARAERDRLEHAAAFAIIANPPGPVQWGSRNFIQPLLDAYHRSAIFEPASGDRAAFVAALTAALARHDAVDLFILAHTNDYSKLLDGVPAPLRAKIRLVYNAGCFNAHDAAAWLSLGVGAYVAHPGESASPVFLNRFRSYWYAGLPLAEAVARANAQVERVFRRRRSSDLLEGLYVIRTRLAGDGEQALRDTRAQLFGDGAMTIESTRWSCAPGYSACSVRRPLARR